MAARRDRPATMSCLPTRLGLRLGWGARPRQPQARQRFQRATGAPGNRDRHSRTRLPLLRKLSRLRTGLSSRWTRTAAARRQWPEGRARLASLAAEAALGRAASFLPCSIAPSSIAFRTLHAGDAAWRFETGAFSRMSVGAGRVAFVTYGTCARHLEPEIRAVQHNA